MLFIAFAKKSFLLRFLLGREELDRGTPNSNATQASRGSNSLTGHGKCIVDPKKLLPKVMVDVLRIPQQDGPAANAYDDEPSGLILMHPRESRAMIIDLEYKSWELTWSPGL